MGEVITAALPRETGLAVKKRTPIFLALILIVFPTEAYGLELDDWFGVLSLSYAADYPQSFIEYLLNPADTDIGISPAMLFGIGLGFPLLFNGKSTGDSRFAPTVHLKIEPMVSVEYSFSIFDSELLRIRTGAHIGRFEMGLGSFGYYAGLSGAFIKDFTNDTVAFGISPEIGFEYFLLFIGGRMQAQYDFYTIERYNRFVFTASLIAIIPFRGF